MRHNGNFKYILDACCGGRMFWFNKAHPNAIYIDNRVCEKGHEPYNSFHSVEPDILMDFTDLKFPDKSFKLVVFDPPHMRALGQKNLFAHQYGRLLGSWEVDLARGFDECWRVLDDFGILIFKWNETEIKKSDVLKLFSQKPLFGHPPRSKFKTHWYCFMKINE